MYEKKKQYGENWKWITHITCGKVIVGVQHFNPWLWYLRMSILQLFLEYIFLVEENAQLAILPLTFIHMQISYLKGGPIMKIINLDSVARRFSYKFDCLFYSSCGLNSKLWLSPWTKPLSCFAIWLSKFWLRSYICADDRRGMLKYKRETNLFIFFNIGLTAVEGFNYLLLNPVVCGFFSCVFFSC